MSEVEIRHATRGDALALIKYVQELTSEPGIHLVTGPGEFRMTVEEEERYIEELTAQENSAVFLALSQGGIVGEISLRGGVRTAQRHTSLLGISARKGWRGRGLGTRLMATALDWARASSPIRRIELFVLAENQGAIRLYEKFGFEVEGRRRRSILKGETYHDDLIMALWLGGPDPGARVD